MRVIIVLVNRNFSHFSYLRSLVRCVRIATQSRFRNSGCEASINPLAPISCHFCGTAAFQQISECFWPFYHSVHWAQSSPSLSNALLQLCVWKGHANSLFNTWKRIVSFGEKHRAQLVLVSIYHTRTTRGRGWLPWHPAVDLAYLAFSSSYFSPPFVWPVP